MRLTHSEHGFRDILQNVAVLVGYLSGQWIHQLDVLRLQLLLPVVHAAALDSLEEVIVCGQVRERLPRSVVVACCHLHSIV